MFRNYLKIAWRNLLKHKMYSIIKLGGFSFSIAACALIGLYIIHEISYDQTYPDKERIFRIVGQNIHNGELSSGTAFPAPLNVAIKQDFQEIALSGRLMPNSLFYGAGSNQITTEQNPESIYEEGFTYLDQELLHILQLPSVYGDYDHALEKPNTVVITESKAKKFFPHQNPVGQMIYLNNDHGNPYTVTAVIKDFPTTSHLHNYDFLLTLSGVIFYPGEQDNWNASNYVGYLKLHKGVDPRAFEKKLTNQVLTKYVIPTMRANGVKEPEKDAKALSLRLQPVTDIHLYSADVDDYHHVAQGDIRYVTLFGGIAIFILLIACINFVNLSTAKSANRAREIGLRRVVGSRRKGLIIQFLAESTLYSFLSVLFGLLLAWLCLPLFNQLTGKTITFPWTSWSLFPITTLSALAIGLFAGLYPAFYLSGFSPINALRGNLILGAKSPLLRNSLVVFQFATSIILIIGTIVINAQMQYVLREKVGFDKDQVLIIQGSHTLERQINTFKDELKKLPNVINTSISDYLPVRLGGVKRNGNTFYQEGRVQEEAATPGQFWQVDKDYLATLGMRLAEGRNFSADLQTDSQAVIINQTMVKRLGLKQPIGARLYNGDTFTVIGVVEDFNFESLRGGVEPICLALGNSTTMLSVKIKSQETAAAIEAITTLWKKFSPHQSLRYTFLDESYAQMYQDVQQTGNIFASFAALAIFIACLGLFGLAAFTTEQRTKEIGIRKVLGASVKGIVQLLSKDFMKLVFVAIVIAFPLAWWAMNKWLTDFAYRIELEWWIFACAALSALLIALLTICFQTIKAAMTNPTKSLRSE
ncbi:ABC transporter permease [Olivibacter sp. SDN3]|uniref:ABC transporter permease n=1 Tax=Olivibacter sp. SDN3 TaxID=2764720 RepID=UPI00165106D0|nr:ABC transporter permease [Olivibacter sp. SDN3]QNL50940.1 ABC transporter permease [Olivibacter sp. SDN3]